MPGKSPHPYVTWRDGGTTFSPGPAMRAQGWKGTDLRWPQEPPADWNPASLKPGDINEGRWFTRGEAVDWSEAFVKSLQATAEAATAARRPSGAPAQGQPSRASRGTAVRPVSASYTVGHLLEEWRRSPKFRLPEDPAELQRARAARTVYSPNTVRDFKWKITIVERDHPVIWALPVEALEQPILYGMYEEMVEARGLATARGVILTLSTAIGWGRRRGKHRLQVNPARDLGMASLPARVRYGTRSEILTLIQAADALGFPEMGDMVVLGVWTGQRQNDRLQMTDKGALNGRRIFRQSKTGAIVSVPEAPELKARLAAAAARRKQAAIASPRVVIDEQAGAPFPDDGYRYRKRFALVRDAAANGIVDEAATRRAAIAYNQDGRQGPPMPVWKVRPCRSLNGNAETGALPFYETNLRDTAVTWLALAGCTIPEICAITGHTLDSANRILKHYLALNPGMADSAISKMIAWYDEGGETEFGI